MIGVEVRDNKIIIKEGIFSISLSDYPAFDHS